MRDLFEPNATFDMICIACPSPALVCDVEGVVLSINRSAAEMFDRAPIALIGMPLKDLFASGAEPRIAELLDRLAHTSPAGAEYETASLALVEADGRERAIEARACCLGHDDGAAPACLVYLKRMATITGCDQTAELARSKFIAMLTHDMRTAFGGVRGATELIDRSQLDARAATIFDGLIASADMLGRLLNEALDLAAIESSALTFDVSSISIADALAEIDTIWRAQLEARSLRFTVNIADDTPEFVRADGARLRQILGNLLSNAAKYTDHGEVRLSVFADAGLDENEASVRFNVDDTGQGFSAEALQNIFVPFSRSAAVGRLGSGLGLSIVKTLCERLGGLVEVSTSSIGGARVSVALPAGDAASLEQSALPQAATNATPSQTRATGSAASQSPAGDLPEELKGRRVMLAEDNATNQMVATQMLESLGCVVTVANDGREALDMIAPDKFDVLLVDIEMPRVSGLDVIRQVRAGPPEIARLPTIALTAYAMREHREKIREAGADGLIAKPILSIEAFGQELAGYINRRAPTRTTAVRQPSTDVVVDRGVLEDLAATIGNPAMRELLDKVLGDLEGVRIDLTRGDAAGAHRATHVLVSVAGAIGAESLRRDAERLNRYVAEGDSKNWATRCASLLAQIEIVAASVRNERQTTYS